MQREIFTKMFDEFIKCFLPFKMIPIWPTVNISVTPRPISLPIRHGLFCLLYFLKRLLALTLCFASREHFVNVMPTNVCVSCVLCSLTSNMFHSEHYII